eukprot:GILK01004579.1.p1 GENE.GILK01004579.1~~GILK01004579.1.p1  ORF type:complete len:613 (+),score=122.65 GILK01004579.1:155-1993(+)
MLEDFHNFQSAATHRGKAPAMVTKDHRHLPDIPFKHVKVPKVSLTTVHASSQVCRDSTSNSKLLPDLLTSPRLSMQRKQSVVSDVITSYSGLSPSSAAEPTSPSFPRESASSVAALLSPRAEKKGSPSTIARVRDAIVNKKTPEPNGRRRKTTSVPLSPSSPLPSGYLTGSQPSNTLSAPVSTTQRRSSAGDSKFSIILPYAVGAQHSAGPAKVPSMDEQHSIVDAGGLVVRRREIAKWIKASRFKYTELLKILRMLRSKGDGSQIGSKEVTFDIWSRVAPVLTQIRSKAVLVRTFEMFDSAKQGSLGLLHFFNGLSVLLKGNIEETLRFCFDFHDLDGSSQFTFQEVLNICGKKNECTEFLHFYEMMEEICASMERANQQLLSWDEFKRFALTDFNRIAKLLVTDTFPSTAVLRDDMNELLSARQDLTLQQLSAIWDACRFRNGIFGPVNFRQFRDLLREHFYIENVHTAKSYFELFDLDGSGSIDIKNVLESVAATVAGSVHNLVRARIDSSRTAGGVHMSKAELGLELDAIRFYLSLFDIEGSGLVSKFEIFGLLRRICENLSTDPEMAKIEETVNGLDSNGDGMIRIDEVIQAIGSDWNMISVLAQCL